MADLPKKPPTPASPDWLPALRAGHASAWEPLCELIRDRVMPAIRLYPGVNRDDVATDTASTVWMCVKRLRDDHKFFAYVATIAQRVATRRRRELSRQVPLPAESRLPSRAPVAAANVEREERLNRMTRTLRHQDQLLFRLLYVVGASSAEAQAELKVSPEILRKRKHRMNLRLREAGGQNDGPAAG